MQGILADASPAFDSFFSIQRDEVILDVEGVGADTFTLFLHHNYGKKLEVSDATDFRTLAELYTLANKFEDKEMLKKVVKRMIELVAEDGEVVFPSKLFESVSTHHVTEVEEAIANKVMLSILDPELLGESRRFFCSHATRL